MPCGSYTSAAIPPPLRAASLTAATRLDLSCVASCSKLPISLRSCSYTVGEGVRVSFGPGEGNGWLLLRLSVHDPVIPLNIESDDAGGCRVIAARLAGYLEEASAGALDCAPLRAFISGGR